jgi:hypothetical protein
LNQLKGKIFWASLQTTSTEVLWKPHANDRQNLKLIHLRIATRAQADPLVHSPFSVPDC